MLDSKEIELQVIDSSKFSSEGFQFTIERFCTCISSLVIEEVENTGEGCLDTGLGIGCFTTAFDTQRTLYCLDSAGVKYGISLNRIG